MAGSHGLTLAVFESSHTSPGSAQLQDRRCPWIVTARCMRGHSRLLGIFRHPVAFTRSCLRIILLNTGVLLQARAFTNDLLPPATLST